MSAFDPAAFLDAQITEVNEARPRIPEEFYSATIGEIDSMKIKTGTYSKGANVGNPWMSVPVPIKLQLSSEAQSLGLPSEFTLTDNVFIDLKADGSVDNSKGKNQRQLDYRKATGLNNAGEPFAWRMLTGRPVKAQVKHKMLDDQRIVENIGAILPL